MSDFDTYRRWFNKFFSLSYNGKFVGLLRLVERGIFDLFVYKLTKLLRDDKHRRPLGDIICMRIRGVNIKLYSR